MDRVVYLLGAGFSAPLGLPVMSNFISMSKDMYFQDAERYDYFRDVFDTIKDISYAKHFFKTDLNNIEEILSILEMRTQLVGGTDEGEDADAGGDEEEDKFQKYIIDVIENFTPPIDPPETPRVQLVFGTGLWKLYGFFVANLHRLELRRDENRRGIHYDGRVINEPDRHYSVITLNYDLVLELAGQEIQDRFGEMQSFERQPDFDRLEERVTPLAKIHGSVDDGTIIPPTWNKGLAEEKIVTAWKLAYELLREANYIRIIGYSLPKSDSYIKYLLRAALPESKSVSHVKQLDVLCYDPDGSVKERYDEFIDWPNYRFVSGRTESYLKGIANYTMLESGANTGRYRGHPLEHPDLLGPRRNVNPIKFACIEKGHEEFFKKYSS